MKAKVYDKYNRWRNKIVSFRCSPEENERIDRFVKLSGLTKQDYIITRLLQKEVVAIGNPRVVKGLRSLLEEVNAKLTIIIESCGQPDGELLETIQVVAKAIDDMNNTDMKRLSNGGNKNDGK